MDEPFLDSDSPRLADVFTDATVHILARHGVDQFSVRSIARWMRVSPATILNEYSRARVIELVVICFGQRWLAWSNSGDWWSHPHAGPLRLPQTEPERHGVRVLATLHGLALAERQRGNPLPLGHLTALESDELRIVTTRLRRQRRPGFEPTDEAAHARLVLATVQGLRASLSVPDPAVTYEEAVAVLRWAIGATPPPAEATEAGATDGAAEEIAS